METFFMKYEPIAEIYVEDGVVVNGANSASIEKAARKTFEKYLIGKGYKLVEKADKNKADITVEDNVVYYYEIKSTRKNIEKESYFGSASFTEWGQAYSCPKRYFFIIAQFLNNNMFKFFKLSVEEMEKYSTIPPIVVFFKTEPNTTRKRKLKRRALVLTKNIYNKLDEVYKDIRNNNVSL